MRQAEVTATESNRPSDIRIIDGEMVVRFDSIDFTSLPTTVFYVFRNDRLVRANYVFSRGHSDLNDFVADFKSIEPVLQEKYGRASNSRAVWDNPAYQDESKSYLDRDRSTPAEIFASDKFVGMEVLLGHLSLFTQWTSGHTKILHALTGEKSRIIHQIEYSRAD
jgi:hypothetical protein